MDDTITINRNGILLTLTRKEYLAVVDEYEERKANALLFEVLDEIKPVCKQRKLSQRQMKNVASAIAEDVRDNNCEFAWCTSPESYGGLDYYIEEYS